MLFLKKDVDINENVDYKKLVSMLQKIYKLEAANVKTQSVSDKEIKEKIINIIEVEAKKCF